ncbi:MAG: alpha/beta fold hydrolase [Alphaproteobacteria bacterium]|nr:alpha/beta fold hydrolase [Alphaproteobacteria bacterium]
MMTSRFEGPNGRIAYERIDGSGPVPVWFGGFRSDMTGGKANRLAAWARSVGRGYLRFDYSGHGVSDGKFVDGCISSWTADALAAIDQLTDGKLIFVGSSMGAWIGALCARARPERLHAFVGLAPAPDFTKEIMLPGLPKGMKRRLQEDGQAPLPSVYDEEPTIITQKLFDDGEQNLVLQDGIDFNGPVRLLQGMRDPDVPWRHAIRFAEAFSSDDVVLTLIKDGDHRLSREEDLVRLVNTVASL